MYIYIDRAIVGFTYVNLNECSATPSSQTSFSVLCFVNISIYLTRKATNKLIYSQNQNLYPPF